MRSTRQVLEEYGSARPDGPDRRTTLIRERELSTVGPHVHGKGFQAYAMGTALSADPSGRCDAKGLDGGSDYSGVRRRHRHMQQTIWELHSGSHYSGVRLDLGDNARADL